MAMKTSMKVLYELPPLSTSPNDDVSFWHYVRFEYARDRAWYRRAIHFKGVAARLIRGDGCSTLWHLDSSDRLVEVENSEWLKEICADTYREDWRRLCEKKHHYMINLRDAGTQEYIADSWELLPEEKGEWPKIGLK